MKPVKLENYRPNKRRIAAIWGTVNSTQETTDKRASWFNCSGHGGFVVNPKDFNQQELEKLQDYADGNYFVKVAVVQSNTTNELYVIGESYEHIRSKRVEFDSWEYRFVEWKKIPMIIFEEDCDWAILAKTPLS